MPRHSYCISIPATIDEIVEIESDTEPTEAELLAAVTAQVGKYPTVKAGASFDFAEFEVLDSHVFHDTPPGT
jgi:hypothetical protein